MPVTKLREWKVIAGNDLPNSDLAMPLRFNIHAAQVGGGEDWGESLELTLESLDFRIRKIIGRGRLPVGPC